MKITGLPINVSFGESDGPDWRKNASAPSPHDEAEDSEDAEEDYKNAVASTLGFDPSELFKDEKHFSANQNEVHFAKVSERGAIVASEKAPKATK